MQPLPLDAHALLPPRGSVALFRALPGLGDFLCVTPALRALREARPDAEITYIGLPETEAMVLRNPRLVDRFMAFPGFPGLPERRPDVRALPRFLDAAQAARFDVAVQLHGSGSLTNRIVELLGARRVAGHVPAGELPPDRSTFLPWVEECSEVRRGLRLMAHLGWESDDERLVFEVPRDAVSPLPIDQPYVVVHPGASTASRRWAARGFREVARALAADGYRIVLTGSAGEVERNCAVAAGPETEFIDITGSTDLDELGAVIRGARLLVANDTGVAHLADALGTPSVIVFTASSPARWGSLDQALHRPAPPSARRVLAEARRLLAPAEVSHAA